MSYNNFIDTVWANEIELELERRCVYVENTNRKYEGLVKDRGDSVRILGVAAPTIYDFDENDITLPDVEKPADTSITMPIRRKAVYNYGVNDIDKAQATPGGIMESLQTETSRKLASRIDAYIASLAAQKEAVKYATAPVALTEANVLKEIDKAVEKLYMNDVDTTSRITMVIPPQVHTIFRQAYINIDTNNSRYLKNGYITRYGGIEIKMSNNVYIDPKTGAFNMMMLTDNAIAHVQPLTHVEAYRPEKKFEDAIKGFILYDAKIVRPKELIVMNVTV